MRKAVFSYFVQGKQKILYSLTGFFVFLMFLPPALNAQSVKAIIGVEDGHDIGCEQLSTTFTDRSEGNPTEWAWDFGNGKTSDKQNPTANFQEPGTYTVTLTVSNLVSTSTTSTTIKVYPNPTVDFAMDQNAGCYPLEVQFTDQSTAGTGDIEELTWDFGDGSPFSKEENPTHTYDEAGTFDVKLTAKNSAGCETSSPAKQVITNEGVTVSFEADKTFSCAAPAEVNFTASTSSSDNIVYNWDFGDGSTGTGETFSHTYTEKGKYAVKLTAAVNGGSCQDQIIKEDYIYVGTSVTDFEIPQGCASAALTFKNTSSPDPISSVWDFGDGGTSNKTNPQHTYNTAGTYTVRLTNDFGGGCTQTVEKEFTTFPSPTADFETSKQLYCGTPAEVTFKNLSDNASAWKWKFGDGDSSSQEKPVHKYEKGGKYDIRLIATSDKGCVDTIQKKDYINIESSDLLDFEVDGEYGCVNELESKFSIPDANTFNSFQWDFGDGTQSTSAHPTHRYDETGTYSVTLQAKTKAGCELTTTKKDLIHIGTKPKVDFTVDLQEICLDTFATFTNLSEPAGDIWKWEFPQDSHIPDTTENPQHQFKTLGPQDVILTVSNNGCIVSTKKEDYIQVTPPKAAFDKELVSCDNPLTYHFIDKSVGPTITKRVWDFGDGEESFETTKKEFDYTFKKAGAKHVKLTVFNGNCSSTDDEWVQIGKENPELTVSENTLCHGNKVTLSVGKFQAATYVRSIKWYNGTGDSVEIEKDDIKKDGNQHQFTYKNNGTYTPAVKITYSYTGCTDSAAGTPITVQGPTAGFTASEYTLCQGNEVTFTDDSKEDPAGTAIKQWEWDFGNGNVETTSDPEIIHLFTKNGTIPVRLKVTDEAGCTDKTTKNQTNSITVNPSSASFTTLDTTVCPNVGIQWVNNSPGGSGTTYDWDFGNGQTSTDKVPQMSYDEDGTYTVSLKVTTDKGCIDSTKKEEYIKVGTPIAVMADPMDKKICRILKDTAISLSKNYNDILWDFGDGTTSTRDTAFHIYNVPGVYTQKLIVNGYSDGCQETAEKQVTITGPNATPVLTGMSGCSPVSVDFSAENISKEAVKFQWFFGNGDVSSEMAGPDISYTYNEAGLYHPVLKLTDDTGCYVLAPINDTLSVVADSIGLDPFYSWPEVCDSNMVLFDTEGSIFSVDSLGEAADYTWDFDFSNSGSGLSNENTPTHRYPDPGTYDARLNVETAYGCKSSIPIEVTIPDSTALSVIANADPTEICKGDPIQLKATSNIGYRYEWSPAPDLNDPESDNPTALPTANTTYQVIAYSQGDCQLDTAEVDVVVHTLPQVDAGPDIVATTGSVVQLNAKGSTDVVQWDWSPADYLNCTHCNNPLSTPTGNIEYTVTAANGFGCKSSDSVKISLVCDEGKVFIPNTFSPNNDGVNDVFYPRGRGVREVVYFRIYDRWGKLIFERSHFQLNDLSSGWDGTFKGRDLSSGVYVYVTSMICDNNKRFNLKGNITLLR